MSAKDSEPSKFARYGSLDDLPPAPPLSNAVKAMSDVEILKRAAADPDAGTLSADFWDKAVVVEPEGTSYNPKSVTFFAFPP